MAETSIRRVVTGIDESGKSDVLSDGSAPLLLKREDVGFDLFELWMTDQTPPELAGEDLSAQPFELEPPQGGVHWRIVVFPHDPTGQSRGHIHRTNTLDFVYIASGEIILQLESADDVHLKAGDTAVLRGPIHAWHNHGNEPCTMVSVMVSAAGTR